MRVPFFWLSLGFVAGIVLNRTGVFLFPDQSLWALLIAGLPVLWLSRGRRFFLPTLLSLLTLFGILYSQADHKRPENAIENFIEADSVRGRIYLEGLVKTEPVVTVQGRKKTVSFILSSTSLVKRSYLMPNQKLRNNVRQSHFFETRGDVQIFLYQPRAVPEVGDRVRLSGSLERPRPVMNFGEFDYRRYLEESDVFAIFKGYGLYAIRIVRRSEENFFGRFLSRTRIKIAERINFLFPNSEQSFLFKALILGTKKGLSPELKEDFMKTGTSHLLAISGLNISLVAGTFFLILIAAGTPQKMAALFAFIAMILQVCIAGFGAPVERSGWMAGAGFLALLLEREGSSLNAFFLAFFMLILSNTKSLMSISFQLSFLSVLSLILLMRKIQTWRWPEFVANSLAVMAGTSPLVLYHFNVFSTVSVWANLGAIPLFHLSLVTGLLAIVLGNLPGIGVVLIKIAGFFINLGLAWIRLWAAPHWGYFYFLTPSIPKLIFYYALLTILIVPRFLTRPLPRFLPPVTGFLFLFTAASFFWPPRQKGFDLTLFSAGRNELAAFHLNGDVHWLINTGRAFPSDQANWIIGNYLKRKGIKQVSGILITDSYKKHTGGLKTILRNFSVEYLLYPAAASQPIFNGAKSLRKVPVAARDEIRFDEKMSLEIFDVVDHQILFGIKNPAHDFIFLPGLNDKILESLKRQKPYLQHLDILILPSAPHCSTQDLEMLFDIVDPAIVTLPYADGRIKNFLVDRDIQLLDLETFGALTFHIGNKDGRLQIDSMLKGKLEA